jgi:hypothetical protein
MTFTMRIAALAAVLGLGLAGCASQPQIPFDKSANAGIHTIGILTPGMPDGPNIWLASDVGQSFGLIGALVDASMTEHRNNTVAAILASEKKVPRDAFLAALQASLKDQGYDSKIVTVERKQGDYLKQYPAASENGVDAYLDISSVNYGYVAAGISKSNPYRPYVYVNCKLVRASDGSLLMQDTILYDPVKLGGFSDTSKYVTIAPDPAYSFPDFDAMTAQPTLATAGIDASFHQTADALTHLMR